MLEKIKEHWPFLTLLAIAIPLCIANYVPQTFLSGWDTLHPEFNFGLNLERTFFGVFRTEQGLGAVAAHSHMVELPRIILLFLLDLIAPLSLVRYLYIFLCFVLGPIGMYLLLRLSLKEKIPSFLGALFYMLNLGTIQIFNVPFEMFTAQYATIPFIFYFATRFIQEKDRKHLLLFSFFTLLSSASAYASTLWYVFFACFMIYFGLFSLLSKTPKVATKNLSVLLLLSVLINSFWLLPNLYFIFTHSHEVQNANINVLFSDLAFLKNKEFGNIADILFLKSFYFDWNIYNGERFTALLSPFVEHIKRPIPLLLGISITFSFLVGLIYFIRSNKKGAIPLISILIVSFFFLFNENPPFSPVFNYLQAHFPIFKEAFRFPDNKIFGIYIVIYSLFFGYFVSFLINFLKRLNSKSSYVVLALVSIGLVAYTLPIFQGNLINKNVKVSIPQDYFDLFNYLDREPPYGKVANFPIHSPWGWTYYDWGKSPSFQGAGFLYFGIKQPLMDRDFDRWSPFNESYYREVSYAVYKKDSVLLANAFRKFGISYAILDENVSDPEHPENVLYLEVIKDLLEERNLVKEEKRFGKIRLYKIGNILSNFSSVNSQNNITPSSISSYSDLAFAEFGDYVSFPKEITTFEANFPLRELTNNQSKVDAGRVMIDDEKLTIRLSDEIKEYEITNLEEIKIIPADLIAERGLDSFNLSFYPNTPILDDITSSVPIQLKLENLQSRSSPLLTVNGKEIFNLSNIPNSVPFSLGKVNLTNSDNIFSVYEASDAVPLNQPISEINPSFLPCDANPSFQDIQARIGGAQVEISGKNDVCVVFPLEFITRQIRQPNEEEVLLSFNATHNENTRVYSCLLDKTTSNCKYYQEDQGQGSKISFTYPVRIGDAQNLALKLFFEDLTKLGRQELVGLTFSITSPFQATRLSGDLLKESLIKDRRLNFSTITIFKDNQYNINVVKDGKDTNDCKIANNRSKKEITSDYLKYSSDIYSFCDHFSYKNIPHNQGYLIRVTSKNEHGLPLTVCVTNYTTRRCDIYSDLTKWDEFGSDIFLLPPSDEGGAGYDINIENLGIRGTPAVNYLKSIEFIPIPYDFLQRIRRTKINNQTANWTGDSSILFQYNPTHFILDVKRAPTIVGFNFSFENGFKAYPVNCQGKFECLIKSAIAPFFQEPISSHLLVNSWANGWMIEKPSKIAILFLPQYLEYLGFIILLGTLIYLFGTAIKRRKQQK